ncbi:MAG: PH domain-containing protein [Actinomycetota bacterium]
MSDAAARTPQVFRASGGWALLVICSVVAVALLVDVVLRADVGALLLYAPWVLLGLWAVYVVGVASLIRAEGEGVLVQNGLRRTFVPWERVRRIDMRWQIVITLDDDRTVVCFGGPSKTRPRRLGPGAQREGVTEHVDAVAALRRWRSEHVPTGNASVRRSWDMPGLAVLILLVAWAVASLTLS